MLRRVLFSLLFVLGAVRTVAAQDAPTDDEMTFVQRLRERGYADLALNYLESRLSRNPKYAAEAPLEIALTRAAQARTEGDAAKRVALFGQSRTELNAFLAKNPMHPKASEIRLETARIASDQGKTQLARAMSLPEGDENRSSELTRAVQLLDDAAKVIETVAAELKTDKEKNENEYERGLLLISQGRAYLALSKVEEKQRDKLEKASSEALKAAIGLLEGLSEKGKEGEPLRGRALTWCGRALSLNAEVGNKVSRKFAEAQQAALEAKDPIALRQIGYFDMLQTYENEQGIKKDDMVLLIRKGETWLRTYPAFRQTPEGCGVQYILARLYFRTGAESPAGTPRNEAWARARYFIRDLEATDNEFAAVAQQLKVDILISQKAFERKISDLTNFDDLYMRALYEHHQLNKDTRKFDSADKRKTQQNLIVSTLKSSLDKADGQKKRGLEVPTADLSSAYYLLTGYHLTLEDYQQAARIGEEFIKKYPRERHANTIALFTARALSEVIKKDAGDDFDQRVEERDRLFKLGQFMTDRWPGDKAGQYGSFLVALHLIKKPLTAKDEEGQKAERKKREDEALKIAGDVARFHLGVERAKAKKFMETILLLRDIKPDFPNFTLASYQLALAALQLDKDDAERAKLMKPSVLAEENGERSKRGEKPLDFGKDKAPFKALALAALERIPDNADLNEPDTALFFFRAKTELGFMYYPLQQYDKMKQLSARLLPLLEGSKAMPDMEKNVYLMRLNSIRIYSMYGEADGAYRANDFAKVVGALDPFVNELDMGKYPELKEDTRLLNAMLGLALRSNLQSGKGQRAMQIMNVWKKFEKEGENTIANVLTATVASMKKQIDELRKKGEKEKLDAMVSSLSGFLASVKGDESKLTPDFRMLLAQCYVPIGRYSQAIELLKSYPAPKPPVGDTSGMPNEEAARQQAKYKVVQVLLIRAYRLQGKEGMDPESLKKAQEQLDAIMKPTAEDLARKPPQPGWGKRDVNALKEEVLLFMDLKAWGAATNRANTMLGTLGKQLGQGGAIRDHYFEVAYFYVVSFTNSALEEKTEAMKREAYLTRIAKFYQALVTNHPTLGGDDHKERFDNFFKTDEGKKLQEYVQKLK